MTNNHLEYKLNDGYIHNWLVAGPLATSIPSPDRIKNDENNYKLQITRQYYQGEAAFSELPIDRGTSEINGELLTWNYIRCQQDHFVDVSKSYPTWQHLRTWAYTEIKSPSPMLVTLVLTTRGPTNVWLNGSHIHRQENFSETFFSTRIQAALEEENTLLVRFEGVALRECENVMALQIADLPSEEAEKGITVRVPTNARYPRRQQALEELFEHAYLEEVVNHRGAHFNLRWAEDLKVVASHAFKIMDLQNFVYVDGTGRSDPAKPADVGHSFRLRERPYFVTLEAPLKEFFEHNLRYRRKLPVHILDNAYSSAAYKDLAQRRQEALEEAAKFETDLFAEIAKMELGKWSDLNPALIKESVDLVNQRSSGSDILLLGLLSMMYRYWEDSPFPEDLKQPIEDCVINYKYWLEDPGEDVLDFTSENHTILFHVCEILAGQRYPERVFPNSGNPGLWHRTRGEHSAIQWMQKRGCDGFIDWHSNYHYEQIIAALSCLTTLAEEGTVNELAAVLLDKMLFTLAVNTYKGSFGTTHGRTHASMIKSAQLEATSGITRFLWGLGVYNHHILGTVSLAISDYEYPAFFADIAVASPEEMLSKERHVISLSGEDEVNTVTYKTPDYMLSSAQDFRPGNPGSQEHIWQATMGPDAVVFTTHPACMSEHEAHRPGFWLGNATLPRVTQWKDVLVAVYNLPEKDWMGFTHAFFPVHSFDENVISNSWAFARKGSAYLALTSIKGFDLIKRGPDGYRELRSYGHQNIWVCQMGREALDGTFTDFQNKVSSMPMNFQELAIQMRSLRGEDLEFGWQDSLIVNGVEQTITGFKHIENPYCTADLHAKQMDISSGEYLLRLNFE